MKSTECSEVHKSALKRTEWAEADGMKVDI